MTGRRRRHLVLLALGLLVVPVGGVGAAQVDPGTSRSSPAIALTERDPWVTPDGTIELGIRAEGDAEPLLLQARVHEPLGSAEELEQSLDDDVGAVIHRSPAVPVGFVPPDADGVRAVRIPTSVGPGDAATARLREPGVYPVVVSLEDDSGTVSEIRTPVIRLGAADDPLPGPTLELIVDLTVPPTIEPGGRRPLGDDELDRLGRLASLLTGGDAGATGPPLTLAVPPDTLDALTASDDPRAATVLEALARDEPDRTALGLPTVPLSAPALVDADLSLFLLALLDEGRSTIGDRLPMAVDGSVWDGSDGIGVPSAALLAGAGVEQVLLDGPDGADRAAVERSLVDAGPYDLAETGRLDAVVVDRATTDELTAPAPGRIDAGHVALADLLLRDAGEETRVLLRVTDAPVDSVLVRLLDLLDEPEAPLTIGPLSAGDQGGGAQTGAAPTVDGLDVPGGTSDLDSLASRIRETSAAIDSFAGLVGAESARADSLRLRVATSVASGLDRDRRTALLDAVERDISEAFAGVHLSGQTDLNLTSRSGTLPLQIRNENDFPVDVVLQISSDRLRFPEGQRFEISASEEITRVDIPVRAQATGSVPTFVQLTTPDGTMILEERRLDVRSTAVSGVGLTLSLGALAVLIIWWARTWHQSRTGRPEPSDAA